MNTPMDAQDQREHKNATQQRIPNERLRRARELAGWSQQELARRLNENADEAGKYAAASAKLIGRWERGDATPSPFYRERLCQFFDMDAEQLGFLPATNPPSFQSPAIEISTPSYEVETPAPKKAGFSSLLRTTNWQKYWLVRGGLLGLCLLALAAYGFYFALFTDPYVHKGRLAIADSLARPVTGLNWQEGENAHGAMCLFKNNAYYAFQPRDGFFHACMAQATDFRDLAFEVEMTRLSGDYAGLLFRANSHDASGYFFELYSDGGYVIRKYKDQYIEHATIIDKGKTSVPFAQKSTHLIAVVADEENVSFYVDRQRIAVIRDRGYTHGQIGLLAGSTSYKPEGRLYPPAEASFQHMKIWTW